LNIIERKRKNANLTGTSERNAINFGLSNPTVSKYKKEGKNKTNK
jgi:hypothetical protein